jgi:hypothetical protein
MLTNAPNFGLDLQREEFIPLINDQYQVPRRERRRERVHATQRVVERRGRDKVALYDFLLVRE